MINLFNKNLNGFSEAVVDGNVEIKNNRLEVSLNSSISGGVETLDNEQNSTGANFGFGEFSGARYRGQVFTCNTTGDLSKIGFARNKGSTGLKVYFDTVDGSNLPAHSVGSELYSFTIPYADVIDEYGEYELPVPFAVTAGTKYCFYLAPWDVAGDVYSDDYQDVRGISSVSGGVKEITYNGGWSTEDLTFQYKVYVTQASVSENYAKIITDDVLDLTNDYVRVRLTQVPISTSKVVAFLRLFESTADGEFLFYYKEGSLHGKYINTSGSPTTLGSVTYDKDAHKYLQIRHSGSSVHFDVSNDLINWSTLFVTTHNLDLTDIKAELGIELTEAETEFNVVAFNDYNVVAPVILPNRKFRIKTGFEGELIDKFNGVAEYPDSSLRETKFHIYDALEAISEFKLSAGGLAQNVRTDIYIQSILDEVYADYFLPIVTTEVSETWTDDGTGADNATFSDDTSNFKYGASSRKIEVDNGVATTEMALSLDLSAYDALTFDFWTDDVTTVDEVVLRLYDGADYYSYSPTLVNGWKSYKVLISDMTVSGTPSLSTIDKIEIEVTSVASEIAEINFDEVRAVVNKDYPQRIFDSGLSVIPVVWWGGNTALYEIKTASEAEGARFFADEQGRLIFQNRQHFNANDEFKSSRYGFDFNNATDLVYAGKLSEIINKVTVVLKPRRTQSTQVVWSYFDVPKQIGAGETLIVWANFDDPVFNVVTPASTTDYTGNANSDGSGADRTSDITITTTKFGTSTKLEIENTSGTSLYLTKMQLRGDPAIESSAVLIEAEDTTSIARYGVQPTGGLVIENKYAVDEEYAQSLADLFVEQYGTPNSKVIIKGRAVPHLQLGDMVSVNNSYLGETYIMRIIQIKEQFSAGQYNAEYKLRHVTNFETLEFFTIATSSIEGTDVISF